MLYIEIYFDSSSAQHGFLCTSCRTTLERILVGESIYMIFLWFENKKNSPKVTSMVEPWSMFSVITYDSRTGVNQG